MLEEVDLFAEYEAVLGERQRLTFGKDLLAARPGGELEGIADDPGQRVRRPARGELEERPGCLVKILGLGDRLARGIEAPGEVAGGGRDRRLRDALDRPVRIGEADVAAGQAFFLSPWAANCAGLPVATPSGGRSGAGGGAKSWRAATRASMVLSESWSVTSKLTM